MPQRPKISVYIATSLDGFIARENGGLDWLEKVNPPAESNEDYGYKELVASVDALVMGRNTYEVIAAAKMWPYQDKRVIVLSTTLSSVSNNAELYEGDIVHLTEKLHSEGVKHIYVDGGVIVSQFLNAGYIDQITLSIVPVILGSGIALFKNILNESWYQLASVQSYPNGLVQLKYHRV